MTPTAVVHLIRRANGLESFRAFLNSYVRYDAGTSHELCLVCKGFESPAEFAAYERLLAGVRHTRLFVPDTGFDIGAYRSALDQTNYDYYCFLNSFSVILAPGWLAKMQRCWHLPNVGLVGATGSYESTAENLRQEIRAMRGLFRRSRFRALVRLFRLQREYPGFPNPSLRTNAFAGWGEMLRSMFPSQIETKDDVLRFESGYRSLTRQVHDQGLDVLVVGRNGQGYSAVEWPSSGTFRHAEQDNLLIADNQTERYARASRDERDFLAKLAWGAAAAAASGSLPPAEYYFDGDPRDDLVAPQPGGDRRAEGREMRRLETRETVRTG